jgi:hypothetical protein
MQLELLRVGQSPRGTFGVIRYEQIPFVLTLERPWVNNEKDVSCIPAGAYRCRKIRSPKFGDTYEICNVQNRTNVLFHKGNFLYDTHGCILVGEEFSGTFDRPFVASSERGFLELMKLLNGAAEFDLVIIDAPIITAAAVSI